MFPYASWSMTLIWVLQDDPKYTSKWAKKRFNIIVVEIIPLVSSIFWPQSNRKPVEYPNKCCWTETNQLERFMESSERDLGRSTIKTLSGSHILNTMEMWCCVKKPRLFKQILIISLICKTLKAFKLKL